MTSRCGARCDSVVSVTFVHIVLSIRGLQSISTPSFTFLVPAGVRVLEANPSPPLPGHIYRVPQDGAQLVRSDTRRACLFVLFV